MDEHNFPVINDQNIQEALTGYVLGALEPEEMLAVDRYLAVHPELQTTVARLEETAAQLAYTAPQAAPPRFVKARLMARARAEARATHRPAPPQPDAPPESPYPFLHRRAAEPSPTQAPYRPLVREQATGGWQSNNSARSSWKGIRLAWRLAGIGATAALLYFMGIAYLQQLRLNEMASRVANVQAVVATVQQTNAALQQQNRQMQQTSVALQQQNQEMQEANAALQQQNAEIAKLNAVLQERNLEIEANWQAQQQQIAALLNAQQVIALSATSASGARGALFVAANSTILLVHGLAPLPADQVYALWLIPEGDLPVLAGSIQVAKQGDPTLKVNLELPITNFANVGLTVEPAQIGSQPTSALVLAGIRT